MENESESATAVAEETNKPEVLFIEKESSHLFVCCPSLRAIFAELMTDRVFFIRLS